MKIPVFFRTTFIFGFMRSFLVFCCLISTISLFSQRDSSKIFTHSIGGGLQFLSGSSDSYGHYSSEISYKPINPFFFYRATYNYTKLHKFFFQASFYERKGHGKKTDGGLGGYGTYEGDFDCYRADLGISKGWALGPPYGPTISLGVNLGFLVHASGNITESGYSKTSGYSVENVNVAQVTNDAILGLNFEICQRVDITYGWLLLGLRGSYCGADAFWAPAIKGVTFFTGYQF